jgi:hypothetical protein
MAASQLSLGWVFRHFAGEFSACPLVPRYMGLPSFCCRLRVSLVFLTRVLILLSQKVAGHLR